MNTSQNGTNCTFPLAFLDGATKEDAIFVMKCHANLDYAIETEDGYTVIDSDLIDVMEPMLEDIEPISMIAKSYSLCDMDITISDWDDVKLVIENDQERTPHEELCLEIITADLGPLNVETALEKISDLTIYSSAAYEMAAIREACNAMGLDSETQEGRDFIQHQCGIYNGSGKVYVYDNQNI